MFIGHPRSGHTLVGSLLNAHPEVVIAHELNALRYLAKRLGPFSLSRDQLYAMILERDRWFQRRNAEWTGYAYAVSGQWQGRFETLRVIGDKKGGGTSRQLELAPGLLEQLRLLIGVPLRLLLVVRNPFDNITTMWRRNPHTTLDQQIECYFQLADSIQATLRQCALEEIHTVSHEHFVTEPATELEAILKFIGVEPAVGYLNACTAIVRPAPHFSRHEVDWPDTAVERVERQIARYGFLDGYCFEE